MHPPASAVDVVGLGVPVREEGEEKEHGVIGAVKVEEEAHPDTNLQQEEGDTDSVLELWQQNMRAQTK